MTTDLVVGYYEVGTKAVESLGFDNRPELEANGYNVPAGAPLA